MSKLEVRSQLRSSQPASPETLELDHSSLQTVLSMLELIDSAEDLALLETLTPGQKRQVWDATPDATRSRLKQLRSPKLSPSLKHSHSTDLIDASDLISHLNLEDRLPEEQATQAEETAAIDLEAQRQEVDLMLQEPLNLSAQPTVCLGDWVVLHAKPKLTKAEMQAIWEVIELQGNYARIVTQSLGSRIYPTAAMSLYPRPVELPAEAEPF
jgi:hydrogenase maturation factor